MNDIFGFFIGVIGVFAPGFGSTPAPIYAGYVEADYVYAASPGSGLIEQFAVEQGQVVETGDVLFRLSHGQQDALLAGALARATVAEATAKNLATGSRSAEVDVIRATLNKAQADLALAKTNLERGEKLEALGLTPLAKLDQERASLASAQAQVDQLMAQLAVAELPARSEQQSAAEASLLAAQADVNKARADLADRTILAPQDGVVDRLFYSQGEFAPAGAPVVALLPPGAIKVKFYVDETSRSGLQLGDGLLVSCDGCVAGITAKVSFFAADPQFTPPVIYSRQERSRLVFLVEAMIDPLAKLHPGQPVSIEKSP